MPSNKNKSIDVFLSTEWRFLHPKQHKTSHFRDVLPKPISWLSTEETKPDTIKANNWESNGLMCILLCTITVHNKEQQQQSFYGPLSGTTRVSQYQTHQPSWSSSNLNKLHPSTTFHSILLVQIVCLTILLHNLSRRPLWSGVLHLIFHRLLHPISPFFLQHMPIPSQPVLLQYQYHSIYS